MQVKLRLGFALLFVGATGLAHAEGYAVGGVVGLDGVGVEFSNALTESFNVSMSYGAGKINTTRSVSGISYTADTSVGGIGFKASYFPFASSGFHATAGFLLNNTEIDAEAQSDGGVYYINDNAYPANAVGSMKAKIQFPSSSPYLGIGWGNPVRAGSRLNVTFDVGVQYLKSINASLTASCNNSVINQLQCTQLKNDVALEERQLQDEVNKISWWPTARIGVHYQF